MVGRAMVALALLLTLVAPSDAQDTHPTGRIAATLYPAQGAAQRIKAAAPLPDSAFKADPEAPIHIEADRLVEVFDGAKQAVFTGIVKLQQGDFQLRTVTLTAFYSGQSGFSTGGEWRAEQLTRAEARERVLIMSKDGQTRATADWATFNADGRRVIALRRFPDFRVPRPRLGNPGTMVAEGEVVLRQLIADVIIAGSRMIDAHGERGYLQSWHHPFQPVRSRN